MAIDLASRLSPYEPRKMLPLDVLAAVASETLRNEIRLIDSPERKVTSNSKRQVKKSTSTVMTFDDIKCLPVKSLVDKFSEMTSDELTKKYSYKCLLIPHVCSVTYKSFGNEKKALDKMKSHLLSHLEELALESKTNKEISCAVFVPKSPVFCSKQTEKLSKKSIKRQQILQSEIEALQNAHKVAKKVKVSFDDVKKKFLNFQKKRIFELTKSFGKAKRRLLNTVNDEDKLQMKQANRESSAYDSSEEEDVIMSVKGMPEGSDVVSDKEKHSAYCNCLNCIFLSDDVKEENDKSHSEQMASLNDSETCSEQTSSNVTAIVSHDKSLTCLHDHTYSVSDETKGGKLSQDVKNVSRKNVTWFPRRRAIPSQLIIITPPFPFVHTPLLPEIAQIEEVGNGDSYSGKYGRSNLQYFHSEESKYNVEEKIQNDEHMSDQGEKYAILCKVGNGSVLECVENIVNTKLSNASVPKTDMPANENDENSENLQRIEKELALKYIAKLHAEKKKRIPDSLFCKICPDKHFTAQATLIHHYRSHAGIKPYVCKICSSTFTRQHSLNYHMLIHQNRSRFSCTSCGRTFRHPSHFKEHLRRHTGETPYHCTDCNLHFKTRNTFKRHLKTRHAKLLTASGIEDLNGEEIAKYCPKTKLGKQI